MMPRSHIGPHSISSERGKDRVTFLKSTIFCQCIQMQKDIHISTWAIKKGFEQNYFKVLVDKVGFNGDPTWESSFISEKTSPELAKSKPFSTNSVPRRSRRGKGISVKGANGSWTSPLSPPSVKIQEEELGEVLISKIRQEHQEKGRTKKGSKDCEYYLKSSAKDLV